MKLDFLRPDFWRVVSWYLLANLFLIINDLVYWCYIKSVESECTQISIIKSFFKFFISILSPFTFPSRFYFQAKMGDWLGFLSSFLILVSTYVFVCGIFWFENVKKLRKKKRRGKYVAHKGRR